MKNITGKRFNKLVAIQPIGKSKRRIIWLCRCDCGNYINVPLVYLTQGWRGSCGCLLGGPPKQDLIGRRFGRLVVLSFAGRIKKSMDKNHQTFAIWNCQCDCGKKVIKTGRALLHDGTKSCGCLQKEVGSLTASKKIKPETFLKRFYVIYQYAAKHRGISWNLSIEEFENLVKQNCYLCGCSPEPKSLCRAKHYHEEIRFNGIDRVNNSLGYEKNNCFACCTLCNKLKNKLSLKDFYSHIERILQYYPSSNIQLPVN